ncbi:MAG TPA: NAD(P)-binding domain-containing protein [Thermoleophilaceae bacterium]|jgi:predicted dinucleotide-binding enzyme
MRIGVLGTGVVGRTIGSKLVQLGHEVTMGSRSADNESATGWASDGGENAAYGTFEDAAGAGELVFNCTSGTASLEALAAAGADNLSGKLLVDVTNPLDFSAGFPPSLSVMGHDSLAEQIQRAHPDARVVKTLNTMNCEVMVDPGRLSGDHDVFVCGDDDGAKAEVSELLQSFGWAGSSIVDLGELSAARGTEAYVLLWVRLYGAFGTGDLNIKVVR